MFDAVSIAKCEDYSDDSVKKALEEVLDNIGGLDFVQPGMKIAIKANLVSAMEPGKAATTHPALLKRLCIMLMEKGARVVVGDSPGGLYTSVFLKNVYRVCGLADMEKELSQAGYIGKISLNEDFSVKDANYPEAVSIKTFIYTAWLDNADAIINFSKLKTHAMMGMSCAVKNMFGTIPGTTKPEYHMRFPDERAFANMMLDLNEYFKPVLYVVDAIDAMEGNGPTAGEKRHIGAVLASVKPYALDMVCADLIGMGLNDSMTLCAAYERGLGPKDVSEVDILGKEPWDEVKVPDFKRATIHQSITFEKEGLIGKMTAAAVKFLFSAKPQVKKNECIGCRKCFETCPAHAITMVPYNNITIPEIDRSKCIKCFCCQEFCPKGAMKVKENPIGKMVRAKK